MLTPGGPYRIMSLGGALGVGLEDSHYAQLSAVAKGNTPDSPYSVPNEYICAEIAHFLRLPVPSCGIIYAPDAEPKHWFASLDFNLVGEPLPPVVPARCIKAAPDVCTGTILFDLLVANRDRHANNLSMDTEAKPSRMNLFDHGKALFGDTEGEGEERLRKDRDAFVINRHCLLPVLPGDRYMNKWIQRINALPDFMLEEVCHEAVGLGVSKAEADAAIDFLKHRRDTVSTLIEDNKSRFQAIKTWSLF